MRYTTLFIAVCLVLSASVYAWTKEDYEIFDLVSALEAAEGKGIDFYKHVGVEPSATTSEITKAYRKRSLTLHPDKNPGVKDIQERFARLGVIAQILRSPEKRERYNFFYKNGVPRWRGTGYYYSRYRPTLSHTLIFLIILTSGLHYIVLSLNYKKHQRRIEYFKSAALSAAGVGNVLNTSGEKVVVPPGTGDKARKRRVKVPMVQGNDNAGVLELIVKGDQVYLPHEDGTLEPLSGLAPPPSIMQTWFASLVLSLSAKTLASLPASISSSLPTLQTSSTGEIKQVVLEDDEEDSASALDTPTPAIKRSSKSLEKERLTGAKGKSQASASRSNTNTPKDSPATTELESDEGEGDVAADGGKKKRLAGGKAGAARRRKMALKK